MTTTAYDRIVGPLRAQPGRVVLVTDDERVTAGQLGARAEDWAQRLLAHGVERGARVAVLAEAAADTIALMLGVLRAGCVYVPVNPRYRGAELAHIVTDSQAAMLLCHRALADDRLDAVPPTVPRFAIDEGPGLPALPDAPTPPRPASALHDDEPAMLVYTSGTTGRSKGVALCLRGLVGNIFALTSGWRFAPSDRLALALPLFHVHGLCIGIFGSLLHGTVVRLHPRFDPAAIVADFDEGATIFMGVPTMYGRLLEYLDQHPQAGATLSRGRLFTAGSAALRPATLARFEQHTGHRILERYGMSETLLTLSNPYEGERRPGSVGHPVGDVEIRVVDDQGNDLPDGEVGELWVRSQNLMLGYWNLPEQTTAAFTDGWFRTGDVVTRAPDGYVKIVGRRSTDIIKSGGFKISALEIEEVLREHPGVAEVAVVGVPDARWGERIAAAVVPGPAGLDDRSTLTAWVAERLADYKKPRQVAVFDTLPRNALGKVQKPKITARLRRPDDPATG